LAIPSRTLDLIAAADEIERVEAAEVGSLAFMARVFCQSALPYRNPGEDESTWIRRNGTLTMTVQPRSSLKDPEGSLRGPKIHHHAYGVIPRILLAWFCTEIKRGSDAFDGNTLLLGSSLRDFLGELGISYGGANVRRVRDQMQALLHSRITIERTAYAADVDEYTTYEAVIQGIASRIFLAWSDADPAGIESPRQASVTFTHDFIAMVERESVPIDSRALAALRTTGGGGLAIDIYTWLVHRLAYLRQTTLIPWEMLELQFGSQYKRTRAFKEKFLKELPHVLLLYPAANVTVQDHGLLLAPSTRAIVTAPQVKAKRLATKAGSYTSTRVAKRTALGYLYPANTGEPQHLLEKVRDGEWTVYDCPRNDEERVIAEYVPTLREAKMLVNDHLDHLGAAQARRDEFKNRRPGEAPPKPARRLKVKDKNAGRRGLDKAHSKAA
jgi:hypothetical protein